MVYSVPSSLSYHVEIGVGMDEAKRHRLVLCRAK